MLEAVLASQRHTLLNVCSGLTGAQLATRAVPPSTLSLLGLMRHMAKVERVWFRQRVAGIELGSLYPLGTDIDFDDIDPARAGADHAQLIEESRLADAAVAALPLDTGFALRGEKYSLRLVYLHMIEEYARHNGHADILRQLVDGATGR